MELIDCGSSGTNFEIAKVTWESLGMSEMWTKTLRLVSGTNEPRPVQVEAFSNKRILDTRRNIIVTAPTNAGKSLVGLGVLLDAIRHGGRAVLLEPLRALAREKAEELVSQRKEIGKALGIDFQVKLTTGDYRLADEHFAAPPPQTGQLIIATPERFDAILRNPSFQEWVESVSAVCVDEAHLISNPRRGATLEYLLTSLLARRCPPRLVLLSASLGQTERVQNWLKPCDVVQVFDRCPALHKFIASLSEGEEVEAVLIKLVEQSLQLPDASVLVFVYQTSSTVTLCRSLNERLGTLLGTEGAKPYHAQMSSHQRELTHKAIVKGNSRCVVATTALGLGVNLPATQVIIRDVTFPGVGLLPITDILQMAGRAGRGNRPGTATVFLRQSDKWPLADLARQLRDEPLPEMSSSFDKMSSGSNGSVDAAIIPNLASLLAMQLARQGAGGLTNADLKTFFLRSLGGQKIANLVDEGLRWLSDPSRLIAYRKESGEYELTSLGLQAVRSTLPLEISAGYGQLIRDLLQSDEDDRFLSQWTPLDHLLILDILSSRSPTLRRFNKSLPDQLQGWLERHPQETPVTYREWIRGEEGKSRAVQLLGSLGLILDPETARKTAMLATLRAIVLYERGKGVSATDLERQWMLTNLTGIEENWRDQQLWLVAATLPLLETRCFYYCLREHCQADETRVKRVTQTLRSMQLQLFGLQEHLKYCSPLGSVLKSLQQTNTRIGPASIRRLESAGITSLAVLATFNVDQLVELGLRRDLAKSLTKYIRRRIE